MKNSSSYHLVAVLVTTTFLTLRAQIPNPGSEGKVPLKWMAGYGQALEAAKAAGKPLLLDITTDWCGWSKKMEREVFANGEVQRRLQSFVLCRLNPEASKTNQEVGEKYGVDGYPTLIVANYLGEELGQRSGYQDTNDVLEYLGLYLPLFKDNPLGYNKVQLDAGDPLMKALERLPKPDSMPTTVGSFIVLDYSNVTLQTNGVAKYLTRSSYYVVDPEKPDLPSADIRYNSSRQKARFTSVRLLNTRGQGREVDVKLAKDEHAYSNQNVYWDVRSVFLALPSLKEGQIVDIIEEKEDTPVIPNQFFLRWNTGLKMMLSSDLSITFPPSLNLQKRAVRCKGVVQETKNRDGTLTWSLKTSCSRAFEPELFSPAYNEIWEGYDFYTPCTKDAIARWYSSLCQGRDVLPPDGVQKVAELKKTNATPVAQLQGILDWITKDIRYVSVAFGLSSHQPHPVSDTLTNLYGDCKDQALLLKALCREAGIPASLVLVGSLFSGISAEQSPAVEMFDHCIVEAMVGGKPYYIDPAAGPSEIGQLAPMYSGFKAYKVSGDVGAIVTLPTYQPRKNDEFTRTSVKLHPNGSATITEVAQVKGAKAKQAKLQLKNMQPDKYRKYLEEGYKRSGRKLLDFFMTDPNAVGDTYETRISYTSPRFGSLTASGLVFKLGSREKSDDWIAALNAPRTKPFRFYPSDPSRNIFEIELPSGATLKDKPADLQLDLPFLKASRKTVYAANKLTMTESFMYLDARVEATDAEKVYAAFRKLQDHRDYAVIVKLPPVAAPESQ